MRMQRNSTRSLDRITVLPAEAQRDFPKPDIQIVQIGQTPIQTFAAPGMSVSHADEAAVRRIVPEYLQFGLRMAKFGVAKTAKSICAKGL